MQNNNDTGMNIPTPDERKLLTKFRSRVFDILKPGEDRSDHFLIRWIRASDGNIEKAEVMLRKSFQWRSEMGADICLSKPFDSFMMENYPFHFPGILDTLGHPVVEVPLGSWDVGVAVGAGREDDFIYHGIQMLECILAKIRESNRGKQPWEFQNTMFTAVVDWNGYSYSQLANWKAVQCFLKLASIFDTHYPESLYRAFYINCPAVFPKLYALLKPVLRESTNQRLKIYGHRREDWEPKLKRMIDINQLSSSITCGSAITPPGSTMTTFNNSPESSHSLKF